jgi:hypothetical protein
MDSIIQYIWVNLLIPIFTFGMLICIILYYIMDFMIYDYISAYTILLILILVILWSILLLYNFFSVLIH